MATTLTIDQPVRYKQPVQFELPPSGFARSSMNPETAQPFDIPSTSFRVWDAMQTNLPATGGTDDLGLYTGTFGTDFPHIATGDVKAAGAVTRRASCLVMLPANYVAGEAIQIGLDAGMKTTVADTSATIDVECYASDRDSTPGASDLCATAAQSINSTTFAEKGFSITPTGLEAGDVLQVRITIATNDAATGTAVIGVLAHARLECTTRG